MGLIHIAHTQPVNPTGASPTLTFEHIWAGALRAARRQQDFVKVITDTQVLEESDTRVKRRVRYDGSVSFLPAEAVEIVTMYPRTVVGAHS